MGRSRKKDRAWDDRMLLSEETQAEDERTPKSKESKSKGRKPASKQSPKKRGFWSAVADLFAHKEKKKDDDGKKAKEAGKKEKDGKKPKFGAMGTIFKVPKHKRKKSSSSSKSPTSSSPSPRDRPIKLAAPEDEVTDLGSNRSRAADSKPAGRRVGIPSPPQPSPQPAQGGLAGQGPENPPLSPIRAKELNENDEEVDPAGGFIANDAEHFALPGTAEYNTPQPSAPQVCNCPGCTQARANAMAAEAARQQNAGQVCNCPNCTQARLMAAAQAQPQAIPGNAPQVCNCPNCTQARAAAMAQAQANVAVAPAAPAGTAENTPRVCNCVNCTRARMAAAMQVPVPAEQQLPQDLPPTKDVNATEGKPDTDASKTVGPIKYAMKIVTTADGFLLPRYYPKACIGLAGMNVTTARGSSAPGKKGRTGKN